MLQILEQYFKILLDQFVIDIATFSQPYMYKWLCIPAFFYLIFFAFKWIVLWLPLIIPVNVVRNSVVNITKAIKSKSKTK